MNLLLEKSPYGIVIHFGEQTPVAGYNVVLYTGECPIKLYTDPNDKIRAIGIPCEYLPPKTIIKKVYDQNCDVMGVFINDAMYKGLTSTNVSSSEYKVLFSIRNGCILKLELLEYTKNFHTFPQIQPRPVQTTKDPQPEPKTTPAEQGLEQPQSEKGDLPPDKIQKRVHRLLPMNYAPMLDNSN